MVEEGTWYPAHLSSRVSIDICTYTPTHTDTNTQTYTDTQTQHTHTVAGGVKKEVHALLVKYDRTATMESFTKN